MSIPNCASRQHAKSAARWAGASGARACMIAASRTRWLTDMVPTESCSPHPMSPSPFGRGGTTLVLRFPSPEGRGDERGEDRTERNQRGEDHAGPSGYAYAARLSGRIVML